MGGGGAAAPLACNKKIGKSVTGKVRGAATPPGSKFFECCWLCAVVMSWPTNKIDAAICFVVQGRTGEFFRGGRARLNCPPIPPLSFFCREITTVSAVELLSTCFFQEFQARHLLDYQIRSSSIFHLILFDIYRVKKWMLLVACYVYTVTQVKLAYLCFACAVTK